MKKLTTLTTALVAFLLMGSTSANAADFRGSSQDDVFVGTSARDHVSLQRGADVAHTRGGADNVRPGGGADVVYLGRGNDEVTVYADNAVDVIDCGAGYDTVVIVNVSDDLDQFTGCEEFLLLTLSS